MVTYNKSLKKWVLQPVLLSLVALSAIACQQNSPQPLPSESPASDSSNVITPPAKSPQPTSSNKGIYRSDRFDFQFSYASDEFVIDEALATPANNVDSPLETIDIWTENHAQKIRAGEYEGGTEYPANVSVTVSENLQNLSLREWVEQSNQFAIPSEFQNTTVAGQSAIAFQSSGLYENENVVFTSPDKSQIITVTFSKINYGDHDAIYQKAFEQVKGSFAFVEG